VRSSALPQAIALLPTFGDAVPPLCIRRRLADALWATPWETPNGIVHYTINAILWISIVRGAEPHLSTISWQIVAIPL